MGKVLRGTGWLCPLVLAPDLGGHETCLPSWGTAPLQPSLPSFSAIAIRENSNVAEWMEPLPRERLLLQNEAEPPRITQDDLFLEKQDRCTAAGARFRPPGHPCGVGWAGTKPGASAERDPSSSLHQNRGPNLQRTPVPLQVPPVDGL